MCDKRRKILAIDDVPEIGDLVKRFLSYLRDDQVMVVCSGRQGIQAAQQDPPCLIFLDLMMPDLHGYDVLQQIRQVPELQLIPVIVFSVVSCSRSYAEAQQRGAVGYLSKPFSLSKLLAARDAVLKGDTYYPPWTELG